MLSGPAGAGGILVLAPNGSVTFATIGAGIDLVQSTGGWVLQAQSQQHVVGAKPQRQADGSYLLPQGANPDSLQVYRNGVRQSAGDDYTYEAATRMITPVVAHPWFPDDLVLADFEVPQSESDPQL